MKRVLVLFLFLCFFLIGCGKEKEDVITLDYEISDDYYQVYQPYKKGVSENYIVSSISSKYDLNEVETSLMYLAADVFPKTNSYYQAGQYLTKNELIDLLSKEKLNKSSPLVINDEITINPSYISYIHEQNYVASNGNLKGMAIGIVLNQYQTYTNSSGTSKYTEVSKDIVTDHGIKMAQELLTYLRNKEELKQTRIIIALFLESEPNAIIPGNYIYVGNTANDTITFSPLNENYYLMTDSLLTEIDPDGYNAFKSVLGSVKETMPTVSLIGEGLYKDNNLKSLVIDVNTVYLTKSELIMLGQLVSDKVFSSFNKDINTKIIITVNGDANALIVKNKGSYQGKIYILK